MAKRGRLGKRKVIDEDLRPFRPRKYDKFILIVCEDENTEPYYFQQIKKLFPKETVYVKEIGTGKKPKGIVETAILEREALSLEIKKDIDEVWIVFDKDDEGNNPTTLKNFNKVWELAEEENMSIAFSNEVFEVWLLMHLMEISSKKPIPRSEIYALLENRINQNKEFSNFIYSHGNSAVIDVIFKIGNETKAIQRADKLLADHKGKKPIDSNPSTHVHELVRHLRELISWYSYGL